MINNLTADAKSSAWITTQQFPKKGRRTAQKSGFFMSAARLYLPFMVGFLVKEPSSDGSAFLFWVDCGNSRTLNPATLLSKLPLRLGGPKNQKRGSTMAQLRQKSDQLSVYAKRVQRAIQYHLPKFGESPRILLDPNEISTLSKISVDKVQQGVKELEREGYIARMFKGRRSKAHVFALLNPELKGKAGVWA
jgi:hypothetical protein